MKAEKGISDKRAVQQDLKNTARKELRKQGIPEFECSVLESSDTESQGQVKKKSSIAVLRKTQGLIPCASEEANPGAPRSVFKRAERRTKTSPPRRHQGESRLVYRRVANPEDPLLIGKEK